MSTQFREHHGPEGGSDNNSPGQGYPYRRVGIRPREHRYRTSRNTHPETTTPRWS